MNKNMFFKSVILLVAIQAGFVVQSYGMDNEDVAPAPVRVAFVPRSGVARRATPLAPIIKVGVAPQKPRSNSEDSKNPDITSPTSSITSPSSSITSPSSNSSSNDTEQTTAQSKVSTTAKPRSSSSGDTKQPTAISAVSTTTKPRSSSSDDTSLSPSPATITAPVDSKSATKSTQASKPATPVVQTSTPTLAPPAVEDQKDLSRSPRSTRRNSRSSANGALIAKMNLALLSQPKDSKTPEAGLEYDCTHFSAEKIQSKLTFGGPDKHIFKEEFIKNLQKTMELLKSELKRKNAPKTDKTDIEKATTIIGHLGTYLETHYPSDSPNTSPTANAGDKYMQINVVNISPVNKKISDAGDHKEIDKVDDKNSEQQPLIPQDEKYQEAREQFETFTTKLREIINNNDSDPATLERDIATLIKDHKDYQDALLALDSQLEIEEETCHGLCHDSWLAGCCKISALIIAAPVLLVLSCYNFNLEPCLKSCGNCCPQEEIDRKRAQSKQAKVIIAKIKKEKAEKAAREQAAREKAEKEQVAGE